jgi:hypothetical protein
MIPRKVQKMSVRGHRFGQILEIWNDFPQLPASKFAPAVNRSEARGQFKENSHNRQFFQYHRTGQITGQVNPLASRLARKYLIRTKQLTVALHVYVAISRATSQNNDVELDHEKLSTEHVSVS